MAERFSTQFIKQQGARRKTVSEGGKLVNTFQDSKGFEKSVNAAFVALTDKKLVTSSLNSEQYFYAKSFFQTRGSSETTAITLAVLSMDAAKIQGVSVMKFLEPLRTNSENRKNFESFVAINFFRPTSSKQAFLVQKTNDGSFRSRDIIQ